MKTLLYNYDKTKMFLVFSCLSKCEFKNVCSQWK